MSDFEPTTDVPERIDDDDRPVPSTAKSRDEAVQHRRKRMLQLALCVLALALLAAGFTVWRVVAAVLTMYVILRLGFTIIGSFARPVPAPPPPGELRRVRLTYRCAECGTELRITLANDEVPEPPRHCTEEMVLTGTRDDAP